MKKTKQIEIYRKKKENQVFKKEVWILPTLTQLEHFCRSRKGPLQLCKLISMSENPGDRDLSVKIYVIMDINTQKRSKTTVQAGENFEMILMITQRMFF